MCDITKNQCVSQTTNYKRVHLLEPAKITDFLFTVQSFTETGLDDVQYRLYLKGRIVLMALYCMHNYLHNDQLQKEMLELVSAIVNFDSALVSNTGLIKTFIDTNCPHEDKLISAFDQTLFMLENDAPRIRTLIASRILAHVQSLL
jgi:hypothetical protein